MDSYTNRLRQQSDDLRQSVLNQSITKSTTPFFNDMNLLGRKGPSPPTNVQQVLHIMVKEITFDKIVRDREISTNSNVSMYVCRYVCINVFNVYKPATLASLYRIYDSSSYYNF